MNKKHNNNPSNAEEVRNLQRDGVEKITHNLFEACHEKDAVTMDIIIDEFYEQRKNKYRYPLSQNDEMPNFEFFVFDWNPKIEMYEIEWMTKDEIVCQDYSILI